MSPVNGLPPGIRRRHINDCPATISDDMMMCRCPRGWPHYQAQAGPRSGRQTKTFASLAAARGWKRDVEQAFARGERVASRAPRLREAAEAWLTAADAGLVLARGDKRYKPSTLRGYRRCMTSELYPLLGDHRLDAISRRELNELAQGLAARGLAASTIRNIVVPLRALYRHAIDLEQVGAAANPTRGMRVPAGSGRRTRVAPVREVEAILQALDPRDRALWATAFYTGLRRGELMALRWMDVDLASGVLRVEQNYDPSARQMLAVKSEAGQGRKLPVCAVLRDELLAHRQRAGRARGLVFARGSLAIAGRGNNGDPARPFHDDSVVKRARRRWAKAGVAPIGLHDCRHTFASLMIEAMAASGTFNPKTLQLMLGHASVQQSYDRYGHLFPGAEEAAGRMLDVYLEGAKRSEASLASSRLLEVLDRTPPVDARPVVADLLNVLASRPSLEGLLPLVAQPDGRAAERAASVPQRQVGGEA